VKYSYTASWAVIGSLSLPGESTSKVLARTKDSEFVLTRDPDVFLAKADEASAIARLMLKGFLGKATSHDFETALTLEIEEIKAERKNRIGGKSVLVFNAQGEIDVSFHKPMREHDRFILTFDAYKKNSVIAQYKSDIDAMKLAIALESDSLSHFASLSDGMYLHGDSNKPIYSFSFTAGGVLATFGKFPKDAPKRITEHYSALKINRKNLDSVQRLFGQMADYEIDKLKAFLSGWAALEILISKSFINFEQAFLSSFVNAEQPTLRERFLERIKVVMKDKYRLHDKFMAVTVILFPDLDECEVAKTCQKFHELKELRDSIFHGKQFIEEDLPVDEIALLLRKYIAAYIAFSAK